MRLLHTLQNGRAEQFLPVIVFRQTGCRVGFGLSQLKFGRALENAVSTVSLLIHVGMSLGYRGGSEHRGNGEEEWFD
jgi:hypothetical protein